MLLPCLAFQVASPSCDDDFLPSQRSKRWRRAEQPDGRPEAGKSIKRREQQSCDSFEEQAHLQLRLQLLLSSVLSSSEANEKPVRKDRRTEGLLLCSSASCVH